MIFDGENAFARRSVCRFNERVCPSVLHAIFNKTLPPTRPCLPSAVANECGGAPCAADGAVPSVCTPCDAYAGIAPPARRSPGCATVALKGPKGDGAPWKRTSPAGGCVGVRSSSKGTTRTMSTRTTADGGVDEWRRRHRMRARDAKT